MQSVTDSSIEAALNFIRDQSRPLADARALAKYLEQKRKSLKAAAYLESDGKTVSDKESAAYTDADYLQCLEDYKDAVYQAELLTNQMKAAELRIEVWRSLNANSRRGHL